MPDCEGLLISLAGAAPCLLWTPRPAQSGSGAALLSFWQTLSKASSSFCFPDAPTHSGDLLQLQGWEQYSDSYMWKAVLTS
jgi:hypothetical protein